MKALAMRLKNGWVAAAAVALFIFLLISFFAGCKEEAANSSSEEPDEISSVSVPEEPKPIVVNAITLVKDTDTNAGMAVVYSVTNPNKMHGLSRAKLSVTLKSSDGKVLKTWDHVGLEGSPYSTHYLVAPEETHEYVYRIYETIPEATKAEVTIEQKWIKLSKDDIPELKLLSIDSFPEESTYGSVTKPESITGEIQNLSSAEVNAWIYVVARQNGKIVGASAIDVEHIPPHSKKAFSQGVSAGKVHGMEISYYYCATHMPGINSKTS